MINQPQRNLDMLFYNYSEIAINNAKNKKQNRRSEKFTRFLKSCYKWYVMLLAQIILYNN